MKLLLNWQINTRGACEYSTNPLINNNNRQQYIGIHNSIYNNSADPTNNTIAHPAMIVLQYAQNLLKPVNFYHFLSKPVNFTIPLVSILEICNNNINVRIAFPAEEL